MGNIISSEGGGDGGVEIMEFPIACMGGIIAIINWIAGDSGGSSHGGHH